MSNTSSNATLSGQTGPAVTMTSVALSGVGRLDLDFNASRGTFYVNSGVDGQPRRVEFDLVLTTTLTDTIATLVNTILVQGS